MDEFIQLLCGALGSVGFAMIFRLRPSFLPLAAVGGLLNWGSYLLLLHLTDALFLSCLVASALSAVYAELLAKWLRAPATVFLVPTVIPSIPGSNLYYTMAAAVAGDLAGMAQNAILTAEYAFGIAAGISIVWAIFAIHSTAKGKKQDKSL